MTRLASGSIEIIPLDRFNWEEVVNLEVDDKQKSFIPDNIFSIAQSKFDSSVVYGIRFKDDMVGMIVTRNWNNICWITRIMIDRNWQNMGIGSTALDILVKFLKSKVECQEIRTTVARENIWGLYMFESAGFEMMGEEMDGEIVMVFSGRS